MSITSPENLLLGMPHLRGFFSASCSFGQTSAFKSRRRQIRRLRALAFVHILWESLKANAVPPPAWWLEAFVATARDLEIDETYSSRSPQLADFKGTIWQLARREVASAYQRGLPVGDACARWQSGAYLVETVPSVLYILMRHGHDPEEAIIRAATDTWDNDTVAAIVGAAVGALHGKAALPRRWIENLSGPNQAG
jgi:hypothetical protein